MALKIRLARRGRKKLPFYHIVIANNTAPRDGAFIEKIGTYNPLAGKDDPARVTISMEKFNHWSSVGAKATKTVERIVSRITAPATTAHTEGA